MAVTIVLLILSWQARAALPDTPLADPDSWGYLRPALSWLSGEGFLQTYGRDWLYPAMIALFIQTTGSFAGIVLWQKALGLGTVLLMILAWRGWVMLLPGNHWGHRILTLAGGLPIFIQAVNPQTVLFEHQIRPEAVLSFFVYAQLACLMGYCRYRWRSPRAVPALFFGAGCFFFAYATLLLKPSWLFAAALTISPIFVGLFWGGSLRWRVLTPVVGVGLCGLLLWLPARLIFIEDGPSRTFMPSTLFTIHAGLIEEDLQRKWTNLPETDPEKKRLGLLLAILSEQLDLAKKEPPNYRNLGFDADYLFYRSPLIEALREYAGGGDEGYRAFCLKVYRDAALHNPGGFLAKVGSQFTYFLFPGEKTFFRNRIDLAKACTEAPKLLADWRFEAMSPEIRQQYERYLSEVVGLAGAPPEIRNDTFARGFSRSMADRAFGLSLVFLAAFLLCLALPSLKPLRLMGWGALLLWSAPAGNAFTVSVAHALDLARYRYSLGGYYLFALIAMAVFVLVVIAFVGINCLNKSRSNQVTRQA